MKKRSAGFWVLWGLVIAWLGVIFFLSSQPGNESSESGKKLIEFLRSLGLDPTVLFGKYTSYVIRKTAHFTEYFILALLLSHALQKTNPTLRFLWLAWLLATFYAATDEFHQWFVPARVATPVDAMIDSAGALFAVGIRSLLLWRRSRRADKQLPN